jgi:hypothetical protein
VVELARESLMIEMAELVPDPARLLMTIPMTISALVFTTPWLAVPVLLVFALLLLILLVILTEPKHDSASDRKKRWYHSR